MAAFCAASMLMTLPGVSVYAADLIHADSIENVESTADEMDKSEDMLEEDIILEEAGIPAEAAEPSDDAAFTGMSEEPAETLEHAEVEVPDLKEQEDAAETVDRPEEYSLIADDVPNEETGVAYYTVGNGVEATYDPDTGGIALISTSGGTLWRDWLERAEIDRESVKSIKVLRYGFTGDNGKVKLPADARGHVYADSYLFGDLKNLTSLDLSGFDTSNVTDMSYMFHQCDNLTSLNLGSFDTSKVTNMSSMFQSCHKLKSLDLSGFNTSKVTDMSCMFDGCDSLTSLNLKGLNTSNVKNMEFMFCDCNNLKTIDLSNLNLSKVTDMNFMFDNCTSLTTLRLSGIKTANLTTMSCTFYRCLSLKTIDLSGFNTSKVTNMDNLFTECKSLTKLDLSGFNTSNVNSMGSLFYKCESLTALDLSNFNTSKVVNMHRMFAGCKKLQRLDLKNFKTTNLTCTDSMFKDCENLKYLDIGSFDVSKINKAGDMFTGCNALDILITPSNKKSSPSCYLPHTMYDRNGKSYSQLPVNQTAKVLGRTQALAASIFIDVRDPSHPFYNAIYWAVNKGITKGYPDGTFGINKSCTRGEMVMFLWRYAGQPLPKKILKSPFKDVPSSHAFYKAILWAYQNGITKGYPDGTFGINRNVTRGESMMFLWRLKGKPEPLPALKSPFIDVPETHAFYKAILWGYQKKITTGYTSGKKIGTFGINENCTRGQIVTFLYRARNL